MADADAGAAEVAPAWPGVLRSTSIQDKIREARVLCVGAGGIGCELLKTLVCAGFENIDVIDLDTIETSNLNRQFLFRKYHVKSSKAHTAAEMIRSLKPNAKITAHHANVKEPRFGVDFISGFGLVLNGLDNQDARRHVNRLAMAAQVPLVESGTAGYLGQVTVHLKGQTECYECSPKPVPKTFPVCTLRNTPDKPIHCVVWSKDMLFARMFGANEEGVTDLDERPGGPLGQEVKEEQGAGDDAGGAPEDEERRKEEVAKRMAREDASAFVRRPDESLLQYALRVFDRIYSLDIQRLISMEELWKSRPPPKPLCLAELLGGDAGEAALSAQLRLGECPPSAHVAPSKALGLTNPKEMWSTADNARVFLRSILHYHEARPDEVGCTTFDKDDDAAVEFVTAASNLRSACYSIPMQTLFDAKGMAGNIIHAIATTNAIISGLIVAQALKLLAGCQATCQDTHVLEAPNRYRRLLVSTRPDPPKPSCMACGRCVLTLKCDTLDLTLRELLDQVVRRRLAMQTPTLLSGDFMYEEGDGLDEDEMEGYRRLLSKPLASLPGGGLVSGKLVQVTDEALALSVDLVLVHQARETFKQDEAPEGWILQGSTLTTTTAAAAPDAAALPTAATAHPPAGKATPQLKVLEGGVLELMDDEEDEVVAVVQQRAENKALLAVRTGCKRGRQGKDAEVVELDDDDGDAAAATAAAAAAKGAAGAAAKKKAKTGEPHADGKEVMVLDD